MTAATVAHDLRAGRIVVGLAGIAGAVGLGLAVGSHPLLGTAAAAAFIATLIALAKSRASGLVAIGILYSNAAVVATNVHGAPSFVGVIVPALLLIPAGKALLVDRKPLILPVALPWMAAWLAAQVISTMVAVDSPTAINSVTTYLSEGLLLYLLIANAFRDKRHFKAAVAVVLATGAVLGALSFVQATTDSFDNDFGGFARVSAERLVIHENDIFNEREDPRVGGPIGEKNRYAQIMVVLIPAALIIGRRSAKRSVRLALLGTAALIALGVTLTFSRGAAASLFLVFVIMALMRQFRWTQVAFVVVGMLAIALLFPRYVERFVSASSVLDSSTSLEGADGAVRGRLSAQIGALRVFADNPIIGVGPGNYPYYHKEQSFEVGLRVGENRQPHNLYPQVLAETGIVGMIAWFGIFISTWIGLLYVRKDSKDPDLVTYATALIYAITTYLISSLFLHLAYERYAWLLVAFAAVVIELHRQNERDEEAEADRLSWDVGAPQLGTT